MDKKEIIKIWDKTNGHCHFCGIDLIFENYGKNKDIKGNWNVDHIFPKASGGENKTVNYLPICGECNRLKWHRTGKQIKEIMRYGIVSLREKRKNTKIGNKIEEIYKLQEKANQERRKQKENYKI
jgi:5-methylcytosine-specific restriction endonuclease McrA